MEKTGSWQKIWKLQRKQKSQAVPHNSGAKKKALVYTTGTKNTANSQKIQKELPPSSLKGEETSLQFWDIYNSWKQKMPKAAFGIIIFTSPPHV